MDCCKTPKASGPTPCPRCSAVGKTVSLVTLGAMLPPEAAASFPEGGWFCRTVACPVLYYGEASQTANKELARVRVGCKETLAPLLLCYCFEVTKEDIEAEVAATGRSTASERIKEFIRAGQCDCERKNPAGVCCLGDIRAAEVSARKKDSMVPTGEEHP